MYYKPEGQFNYGCVIYDA